MIRLREFRKLSPGLQILLFKTACLVTLIRLGLWLLPFQTVRALLNKLSQPTNLNQLPRRAVVYRVTWAVTKTSRYIPRATCLTQALAAQVLLLRKGYPAELRIGVAIEDTGRLEAHAWVECDDQIVIGGTDSPHRYTPFSSIERTAQ